MAGSNRQILMWNHVAYDNGLLNELVGLENELRHISVFSSDSDSDSSDSDGSFSSESSQKGVNMELKCLFEACEKRFETKISSFDLIRHNASAPFINLTTHASQQNNMSSHSSYQNTNLAKYLNELTSPSPKQDLKPKKSQERLENSVMEIQVKLDLIRRIRSNFCIDLLQVTSLNP